MNKFRTVLRLILCATLLIGLAVPARAAQVASGTCGANLTWVLDDAGTLTISGTGEMDNYTADSPCPWYDYKDGILSAVITGGVTSVGDYAFYWHENLADVTIANSVTAIGSGAFRWCYALDSVELPAGLTFLGDAAFLATNLRSIAIPNGITEIGEETFSYCPNLSDVDLGNGVTVIELYAFSCCSALEEITIPDSVVEIGQSAFYACEKLKTVNFGTNVNHIGWRAFGYCDELTEVSLPASLAQLDGCVFANCRRLETIRIHKDNPYFVSEPGVGILTKDKSTLLCAWPSAEGVFAIPQGITGIGEYAFSPLTNITEVIIPDSVTHIGWRAFSDSSVCRVTIPGSVTNLEGGLFTYCNSLVSVELQEGVTEIGHSMFLYCRNLTGVKLPQSLQTIHTRAFFNCSKLTSITVPAGVKTVGDDIFSGCNKLEEVLFQGSCPEIGANAFAGVNITAYYPAGDPTWTEAVRQDYGGSVVWEPYNAVLAITQQPSGWKIYSGSTAVFRVGATGTGLQYQWQYRTSSQGNWLNCTAEGNRTNAVHVVGTCAKSGYQYRCRITDAHGDTVVTKTVYLYVLGVRTQPVGQKVESGTYATFTVSATGHNKTYQWQYRTSNSITAPWKNCTAAGNKTATMRVEATSGKSGWQYRCQITDSAGNVIYTQPVYLYVLGVKTHPVNQKVVAGTNAAFRVAATGHLKTYQWQYRTGNNGQWLNCTASGNQSSNMLVAATCAKSGYQYRCRITDSAGNVVYTSTVYLYVLGVRTNPANQTVSAGTNATFTVNATGHQKAYQWQYSVDGGRTWKNATAAGNKTATLTVPGTASRNGYLYRCKITDSAGNVIYTNSAKLTVK